MDGDLGRLCRSESVLRLESNGFFDVQGRDQVDSRAVGVYKILMLHRGNRSGVPAFGDACVGGVVMFSNPQQGMEAGEVARLRQEGGALAASPARRARSDPARSRARIGADYYSFISQIESGRGRVPINQMEAWASALRMSRREFAKGIIAIMIR